MEGWEWEPPDEDNGLKRLCRGRCLWLLFLLLAGIAGGLVGKFYLFVEARCPRLQDNVLLAVAGVATFLAILWAALTKNDAPAVQWISIPLLFGGILGIATFAGGILSEMPPAQAVFCPARICEQAQFIQALRAEGKLLAAEEAARDCLALKPATQTEQDCQKQCASDLVRILLAKSDPISLPAWERGREQICREYSSDLEEAQKLSIRYGLEDLAQAVQERQRRLSEACATPTPYVSPTPATRVEVLRTRHTKWEAFVDVRVFRGDQTVQNLKPEDFRLFSGSGPLPFRLETHSSDDPVCLIAVVDNSGSIRPGLEQIREALRKLNEARKPGDELGMVMFAGHDEIDVQLPSDAPLPTDKVNATGRLTALWDAVLTGLETARSCHYTSRYLILLTDGRDNDSQILKGDNPTRAREVAKRAAEQGISICAVGIASKDLEEEPLHLVATGCGYYPAESFDQVAALFYQLFGYVRDFYRLRMEPGAISPGSKITLQVLGAEVVLVLSEAQR